MAELKMAEDGLVVLSVDGVVDWEWLSSGLAPLSTDSSARAALIRFGASADFTGAWPPPPQRTGPLERPARPVVATIAGDCMDEALMVLAALTDIRIAALDSRFGMPALRRRPLSVARSGLDRQLPCSVLAGLMMKSEPIGAREALDVGLVTEVAESEAAMLARGESIARAIAGLSSYTIWAERQTLDLALDMTFQQTRHVTCMLDVISHLQPDCYEGIGAFVEKRAPRFWAID